MTQNVDRRTFLKAAAAAAVGVPIAAALPSTVAATPTTSPIQPMPEGDSGSPNVVPSFASVVQVDEGNDVLLSAIAANGVSKIFFCGGTDNFHFMESVAKFKATNRPTPDLVTVTDEATAVYMAMGYFQWTRKPQLVILHVNCGTINAGASYDDAWIGNAGIVVMAGRSANSTKQELPGYRTSVQYRQEVYNYADLVKSYCKWYYEIKEVENAALIINRAFSVAASEPSGLAYVTYPREVACTPVKSGLVYSAADYAPATGAQGDPAALRQAAQLLVQAKNPLVMVKGMGRHPEAVASLVALAEKLSLAVVSTDTFMNFPKTHWANSSADLAKRDVVLIIDNPTAFEENDPPHSTKIIALDDDPMQLKYPLTGQPTHLPITCNSAIALPIINQLADEFLTAERKTAIADRKTALVAAKKTADENAAANIEKAKTALPLSRTWIMACINQVLDENTVITWDIGGIGRVGDKTQPGHVFASASPTLGGAWPRAIGIKIAAPQKTVISCEGDGSTIFSRPTSCLMASRMYKAPVLHIVSNNNKYQAVESGLSRYGTNSYAAKAGYNGSSLKPSPDFAGIAKAVGAYGEKVTDPAQMQAALQRALNAVKSGQAALLDCVTEKE